MQFADIDGVTLHYQVIGAADDKPVMVFINSLGTDFRIWRECAVRLVGDYTLVMYDKRGHGLSDVPDGPYQMSDHSADLIGLMDHLGLSGAVLCGVSVGGLIAQQVYHRRPDLVSGLVLCDTGMKIGERDAWNERIATVREIGMDAFAPAVIERWFTPGFLEREATACNGWRNMVARQSAEGYTGTCAAIRDCDLRGMASQIEVSAIAIVGKEDVATPPEGMIALAKQIPDCRYEAISDCGHLPSIEQGELLTEIIRAFMKDANLG